MIDIWHLTVFCLLCVSILIWDLLFRRVPNMVVIAALLAQALFIAFFRGEADYPTHDLTAAMIGFFMGLLIFVPFYAFRAMGAGDVKFFALLGFFLGPTALIPVWVVGSLMAGVHALCVMASKSLEVFLIRSFWFSVLARCSLLSKWQRLAIRIEAARKGRQGIPYAAYLSVGALGFLVWNY
jgi:prepilin peptidase CpaA